MQRMNRQDLDVEMEDEKQKNSLAPSHVDKKNTIELKFYLKNIEK